MDNGIYIALSRQMELFRDMDVTANNIANANTTGYTAGHILFNSYLTKDKNNGDTNPMAFTNGVGTYRNTENGTIKVTGNDLDVAIQGDGYFQVDTPLGIRYTRAGNFQINGEGTLTTPEGYPVLNNSGQAISLPENATSIQIGEAGNMKVNGDDFDTIGIVRFNNPQLLERLNGRLFKSEITPEISLDSRVMQGSLETSNVQPVLELTHMIDVSRSVTNTSQFIGVVYDLERKSADAWAQQG